MFFFKEDILCYRKENVFFRSLSLKMTTNITTTTIIAEFTKALNIRKFVFFMPISRHFQNEENIEITRNNKNNYNTGNVGDIINAVGGRMGRGVASGGDIFKNCIFGYLSGGDNMIHYKVSKKNILLAGKLPCIDTANIIFNYIFDSIVEASEEMERLTKSMSRDLLDWFDDSFKGKRVIIFKDTTLIYEPREDYPENDNVKTKTVHQLIIPRLPRDLPRFWTKAIVEVAYDCFTYEQAREHIVNMLKKEPLHEDGFDIDNVRLSMEAHKHNLDFCIDLQKLHKKLYYMEGLYSTYINTIHDNVRVEMPYKISEENKNYVRKKKVEDKDYLTFFVCSSGYISYSGKLRELNEVGAKIFIDLLNDLRKSIEL